MGNDPLRPQTRCANVAPPVLVQYVGNASVRCAGVCAETARDAAAHCGSRGRDICVSAQPQRLLYSGEMDNDLNPYMMGWQNHIEDVKAETDGLKKSDVIAATKPQSREIDVEPDSEPGIRVIDLDEHIRSGEPLSYSPPGKEPPSPPPSTHPSRASSAMRETPPPKEPAAPALKLPMTFDPSPNPPSELIRGTAIASHEEWVSSLLQDLSTGFVNSYSSTSVVAPVAPEPPSVAPEPQSVAGRDRCAHRLHTILETADEVPAKCAESNGPRSELNRHVASTRQDRCFEESPGQEAVREAIPEAPSIILGKVVDEPALLGVRRLRFEGGARDRTPSGGRRPPRGMAVGRPRLAPSDGVPPVSSMRRGPSVSSGSTPRQVLQPLAAAHKAPVFASAAEDFSSVPSPSRERRPSSPSPQKQPPVAIDSGPPRAPSFSEPMEQTAQQLDRPSPADVAGKESAASQSQSLAQKAQQAKREPPPLALPPQRTTPPSSPPGKTALAQGVPLKIVFEPGSLGISLHECGEVVDYVVEGQQAHRLGVHGGMRFLTVGGRSFTEATIKAAMAGTVRYEVVFAAVTEVTAKNTCPALPSAPSTASTATTATPPMSARSLQGVALRAVMMTGFKCNEFNVVFAEASSEAFQVSGRNTYWTASQEYFLFYCDATRSWTIEKAKRFKKVKSGQVGGIVKGPLNVTDISSVALRVGGMASPAPTPRQPEQGFGGDCAAPASAAPWQEWDSKAKRWELRLGAGIKHLGKVRPPNGVTNEAVVARTEIGTGANATPSVASVLESASSKAKHP